MQNNLQIWKEHLDSNQAFTTPLPEIIADMVKTIPNDEIPQKMKLLMAVNEIVLFTAQFHRNIQHPNGSLIPINSISFIFAPSGVS
ncbi:MULTISPECIES: hypothetical protein [unclassified Campylobacter]|uniref:hypothetical protein n=1 Tax=unclassified Campylobacter TaxID=2593542 RepID=UPI0022E9C28D|nr:MULTISPECIES: hypothetical protein [unclassified Campylobacter]MDA3062460.1 hypothetical protein [Campylobacter sp. JMF_14 EL1]MDA3073421.1 hypothetical protein [Campylobacter sp. JMF_10 EL2]